MYFTLESFIQTNSNKEFKHETKLSKKGLGSVFNTTKQHTHETRQVKRKKKQTKKIMEPDYYLRRKTKMIYIFCVLPLLQDVTIVIFSAAYENNETDWLLEKLCLFMILRKWLEEF